MPAPLKTGLPPELVIGGGYTIRANAVSATTGAVVAGVTVSNVSLYVTSLTGEGDADKIGEWSMVPGPPDSQVAV